MIMKYALLAIAALFAASCVNQPQVVQNSNTTNPQTAKAERRETAIAHTIENQPGKPAPGPGGPSAPGKWSASGTPIDTAMYDGTIAAAEKIIQSKPADETAKKNLADAYYERGVALTQAQQYAAALGDYRRALKYDPEHEGSKDWIGQIEGIYKMLKKDAPKQGEEPPPLPFTKG
jgi:tetratricopeptide (TPR) repeat protein